MSHKLLFLYSISISVVIAQSCSSITNSNICVNTNCCAWCYTNSECMDIPSGGCSALQCVAFSCQTSGQCGGSTINGGSGSGSSGSTSGNAPAYNNYLYYTDLPGADISSMGTIDQETCYSNCYNNINCIAFTWVISTSVCYLKYALPLQTTNSDTVSGSLCSMRVYSTYDDNTDRDGSDYTSFVIDNVGLCVERCIGDSNCVAWSFVKTGAYAYNCYLKNVAPSQSYDNNVISGYIPNRTNLNNNICKNYTKIITTSTTSTISITSTTSSSYASCLEYNILLIVIIYALIIIIY